MTRAIGVFAVLLACSVAAPLMAITFRGGEIRYAPVDGDPLTYQIEVDVYTKLTAWDFPEVTVDFGDGSEGVVPRTNINDFPSRDIRLSTYTTVHTYPEFGSFTVNFDGYSRIGAIINIPNSIAQSACISALIVIDPTLGPNHSIGFDTLQFMIRRNDQVIVHDPGPYEVDGDSVVFELTPALGLGCTPVVGYSFPTATNTFEVDPVSGELLWDAAAVLGEYNVSIRGSEYRNGQLIGQVTRDMSITVFIMPVGLDEVEGSEPFSLIPTVTDGDVTVLNRSNGPILLHLIAANGALVGTLRAEQESSPIQLGHVAPGLYSVKAVTMDGAVLGLTRLVRQ